MAVRISCDDCKYSVNDYCQSEERDVYDDNKNHDGYCDWFKEYKESEEE